MNEHRTSSVDSFGSIRHLKYVQSLLILDLSGTKSTNLMVRVGGLQGLCYWLDHLVRIVNFKTASPDECRVQGPKQGCD